MKASLLALGILGCMLQQPVLAKNIDPVKLPPVNLGGGFFSEGLARPGHHLMFQQNFYSVENIKDGEGDETPGEKNNRISTSIFQYALNTPWKIFGAEYGFTVRVPVIHSDIDVEGGAKGRDSGVGDITLRPVKLTWRDMPLGSGRLTLQSILALTLPTGAYDDKRYVNVGSNYLYLNPMFAGTYFSGRWSHSFNLGYVWSDRNDDPVGGRARSAQPGTAMNLSLSSGYLLSERLRLGLAGYRLEQLNDDRLDGRRVSRSKESVSALGPAFSYFHRQARLGFGVAWYEEFDARNRGQGTRVIANIHKGF
ncbi:Uncharacterized conserved protein [Pseudomonas citronellolis]|uniref:Uncharacterized conserved protein n=1 Tax=Pseudomonas citronellolis TaxID=53408 RepID=A0AAQ1HIS1_9PSED|nr:transporter [Pseudomonas citronellolis]SFB92677.1 Uncharacterized conserved protein [Pseudomonas citronellolis]